MIDLFSIFQKQTAIRLKEPDDGLNQYFIAIVAPQPIFDDALALKEEFKEKYNSKGSLNSPPHITLHMPFKWKATKEITLVDALKSFATEMKSVAITLDGFGSFPPRVIFMNVVKNEPLTALQKALMRFCKMELNLFNADYRDLPFHPHITLAFRDLKKPAYHNAWTNFEHRPYKATFVAGHITLLKHDGKIWREFRELPMKNPE